MSVDHDVVETPSVDQRLDQLYAELADLKRVVILARVNERLASPAGTVLDELREVGEEVTARWTGPDAVQEIRGS